LAFVLFDYFIVFNCTGEIESLWGIRFMQILMALEGGSGIQAHKGNLAGRGDLWLGWKAPVTIYYRRNIF
jgi:hypothetical protein